MCIETVVVGQVSYMTYPVSCIINSIQCVHVDGTDLPQPPKRTAVNDVGHCLNIATDTKLVYHLSDPVFSCKLYTVPRLRGLWNRFRRDHCKFRFQIAAVLCICLYSHSLVVEISF